METELNGAPVRFAALGGTVFCVDDALDVRGRDAGLMVCLSISTNFLLHSSSIWRREAIAEASASGSFPPISGSLSIGGFGITLWL